MLFIFWTLCSLFGVYSSIKKDDNIDKLIIIPKIIEGGYFEQFKQEFTNIAQTSPTSILLYIDSNGGSLNDVYYMTELIKTYGGKIVCIAENAYSAAFILFQYCDRRYVTPNALFIQHEATMNDIPISSLHHLKNGVMMCDMVGNCVVENDNNLLDDAVSFVNDISQKTADRIGITLEDYVSRITDGKEWTIMGGTHLVKQGIADKVVIWDDGCGLPPSR